MSKVKNKLEELICSLIVPFEEKHEHNTINNDIDYN